MPADDEVDAEWGVGGFPDGVVVDAGPFDGVDVRLEEPHPAGGRHGAHDRGAGDEPDGRIEDRVARPGVAERHDCPRMCSRPLPRSLVRRTIVAVLTLTSKAVLSPDERSGRRRRVRRGSVTVRRPPPAESGPANASPLDLDALGYVEHEYFFTGDAVSYALDVATYLRRSMGRRASRHGIVHLAAAGSSSDRPGSILRCRVAGVAERLGRRRRRSGLGISLGGDHQGGPRLGRSERSIRRRDGEHRQRRGFERRTRQRRPVARFGTSPSRRLVLLRHLHEGGPSRPRRSRRAAARTVGADVGHRHRRIPVRHIPEYVRQCGAGA